MNEQHTSAIFGMNFYQDVIVSDTGIISGEYDPEQQLWVSEEQVQGYYGDNTNGYTMTASWQTTIATGYNQGRSDLTSKTDRRMDPYTD